MSFNYYFISLAIPRLPKYHVNQCMLHVTYTKSVEYKPRSV